MAKNKHVFLINTAHTRSRMELSQPAKGIYKESKTNVMLTCKDKD